MNQHSVSLDKEDEFDPEGSQRRLLDMIAGHLRYVEKCNGNSNDLLARDGTYDKESDFLMQLYQEVGRADTITDAQLLAIMTRKVIPFLLNGVVE